jgi:hypothetical protein
MKLLPSLFGGLQNSHKILFRSEKLLLFHLKSAGDAVFRIDLARLPGAFLTSLGPWGANSDVRPPSGCRAFSQPTLRKRRGDSCSSPLTSSQINRTGISEVDPHATPRTSANGLRMQWRRGLALRLLPLPAVLGRERPSRGKTSTRSSGRPWRTVGREPCCSGNAVRSPSPMGSRATPPL